MPGRWQCSRWAENLHGLAGVRAAESAANLARDSAVEAHSEYYTAEEMAEFAKPKKKKARLQPCMQSRSGHPA